MDGLSRTRKGTVINKIEKSLFVHKDDERSTNAEGGLRSRKLFKPLPPAKQVEAEALAAKKAQEEEERIQKEKEESGIQDHLRRCKELNRVSFEYDVNLVDLVDNMIDDGMGSEINNIFETVLYPRLEKLMGRKVTDLDKKFFVRSLLSSNVMKVTKDKLCDTIATTYFKNIGNLQWKGMENYEGNEKTMEKIQEAIRRKIKLAEQINELTKQ
uniref:DUF4806 domain-containing protein n=1 Tax=Strongyloides papillosus TaxID=174720 RepID=A0A0N5BID9_STREA